ncbi:MAG: AAA family ATPase, partial [Campylobacterota bacterium]|nr:AAA family ATPase [Campylobacterota bacterium]
ENQMNDYFIEKIEIKENKHIQKLDIPLSKDTRKHLIFTGKNGSGKTTILNAINKLFNNLIIENMLEIQDLTITINNNQDIFDFKKLPFIVAYFESKRENIPTVSTSIKNIQLNTNNTTDTRELHRQFIEYMVKKRTDMLNDKFDGDGKKATEIGKWFTNFENTLKVLFNEENLKLKYYSEELNFKIEYQGKSFGLNELSDGYSSLLAILTELILRMEAHNIQSYNMQGVVLIDEIETHLHVDLQKKILPFLVNFFPKIQFIVTTHSPFVLSSLSNAVICDLEKNFITEDLSDYSYDALIESYFDSDKYSQEIKDKLERFEELSKINKLNESEQDEYFEFKRYFKSLPTFMADELAVKINEILLNDLNKR